jgi:RNA polymerase sigma-70 factor (ECF subfamily)
MVSAVDPLTRLARQAGTGDACALGAFVEASYEHVWRLGATLVGEHSADDISQETFIRAVRALPGFRGESSARTWLLAIARHVCLDELRGRVRRERLEADLVVGRDGTVADPSEAVTLAHLIGHLDIDRRAAFVLTQVLGLSYQEAARICDCPPGTVRSRVARARVDLVDLLSRSAQGRSAQGRPGRSSSASGAGPAQGRLMTGRRRG